MRGRGGYWPPPRQVAAQSEPMAAPQPLRLSHRPGRPPPPRRPGGGWRGGGTHLWAAAYHKGGRRAPLLRRCRIRSISPKPFRDMPGPSPRPALPRPPAVPGRPTDFWRPFSRGPAQHLQMVVLHGVFARTVVQGAAAGPQQLQDVQVAPHGGAGRGPRAPLAPVLAGPEQHLDAGVAPPRRTCCHSTDSPGPAAIAGPRSFRQCLKVTCAPGTRVFGGFNSTRRASRSRRTPSRRRRRRSRTSTCHRLYFNSAE